MQLIFHRHRVRVDSLFPGYAFESSEDTSIIALVSLKRRATLLPTVVPRQPNEVFLGFGERHKCADTQGNERESNCGAHASMDVLSVADLSHGRCRQGY